MNELITFIWILAGMFSVLILVAILLMPRPTMKNKFYRTQRTPVELEQRHLQHRLARLQAQYETTVELRDCTANLRQQNMVLARLNKLQKITGFTK